MTYSMMIPAKDEQDAKEQTMQTFPDATITKVTTTKVLYKGLPMFWVTFKSREAKKWT